MNVIVDVLVFTVKAAIVWLLAVLLICGGIGTYFKSKTEQAMKLLEAAAMAQEKRAASGRIQTGRETAKDRERLERTEERPEKVADRPG